MSFIQQCFASRQSVTEGARCRVIPMMMGRGYTAQECSFPGGDAPVQRVYGFSRTAEVQGAWEPISGCLEAIAGDYGTTTLVDTPSNITLLTSFFRELSNRGATVPADEREPAFAFRVILAEAAPIFWRNLQTIPWFEETPEITMQEATAVWSALYRPMIRQKVFIADYKREFRPVALGLMHEAAYQWLLKTGEADRFHGDDLTRDVFAIATTAEALADYNKNHASRFSMMESLTAEQKLALGATVLENDLMDRFKYLGCQLYNCRIWTAKLKPILVDHFNGDTNMAARISQELAGLFEDSYVFRGLWLLNIGFEPPRHAGDDFHNEDGNGFLAFCQSVNVAIAEERKVIYSE